VSVLLGDGQGDFAPQQTFNTGDSPNSLALVDLNRDGFIDITTANSFSDNVSVILSREFMLDATRLTQSDLSPCPSTSLPLRDDGTFLALTQLRCRIERLEFDLTLPSDSRGSMSLASPLDREVTLVTLPNNNFSTGLARPERIAPLARFESHPLDGLWTMSTEGFAVDDALMLINSYPDDPFSSDTLADPCNNDEDQPDDPDFACRLDGESLEGATLEDDEDEDVFLLQGDFDGAFVRGQTLTATLTTEPDSELTVGLHAFRALHPLTTALEVEPGIWSLTFTVPSDYSGRYFAIHVRGRAVSELNYDILVE
jgi:hypothetical protein